MTRDICELAAFAADLSAGDLPERLVSKLKATLLHDLGVGLAGHRLSSAVLDLAREGVSGGPAHVLVSGEAVPTEVAVLAHAAMIHARTQDDTQLSAQTHLGSTVIPTVLALGEEVGATGSDMLAAMTAGYEVVSHLARDAAPNSTARGFRASSIFGPLGAATAAAKLLGADADEMAHAIGLAASFGGGTAQTWVSGTDEWQYQVGVAGRNGLTAARLARRGVKAGRDALDGGSGFYRAFCGEVPASDEARPGAPWLTFDVTYKPYPVCAINQTPVATLAGLIEEHLLTEESVGQLDVHLAVSEATYPGTDALPPFDGVAAALMSAPMCLAIALRHGGVTRQQLEQYDTPGLAETAKKVRVVADPGVAVGRCRIVVSTNDGQRIDSAAGAPLAPFDWTFEEVAHRLRAMVDDVPAGEAHLDAFEAAVAQLPQVDARGLVQATLA